MTMPTQASLEQAAREAWPDTPWHQVWAVSSILSDEEFASAGALLALARSIEAQQADDATVEEALAILHDAFFNPGALVGKAGRYGNDCDLDDLVQRASETCRAAISKTRKPDDATVERYRTALERIGWHELNWQEARDAARAALAAVKSDDGWQPIETAPKDGTEFLAWAFLHDDGGAYHADGSSFMGETAHYHILRWEDGCGWVSPYAGSISGPVAWRPLLAPPAIAAVKEG